MSQMNPSTPMTDDAKMMAAALAARTERANKPTLLVAACGLALVGSLVWLLMAWSGYGEAARARTLQERKSQRVAGRVAELLAMRAKIAGVETTMEGNAPLTQLMPRISTAATDVGLKETVPAPVKRQDNPTPAGSRLLRLEYNVADESLPALFAWIQKSLADVPGLELYRVNLRPEQQRWRMQVTFSRWEKVEGT